MKKTEVLTKIIEKSRPDQPSNYQYGRIKHIDEQDDIIHVSLDKNEGEIVPAKLANPCLSIEDLKLAIERASLVTVDFNTLDGHAVVRDIYFSLTDEKKNEKSKGQGETLHIAADKVIIEGKQEVMIKCGESKTVYLARNNKIKHEADKIHSSAKEWNKVQGSSVAIN